MSDYVKGTNYTAKRGTDADPAVFDTEFSAVATASATKVDKTGATMTGPLILTAAAATGETTRALQAQDVKHYSFPAGTKMVFAQAAAPTGWTQDVANNDMMLRLVSAAGGGTGGSASPIVGPSITSGHAITIAEMPAHTHSYTHASASGGGIALAGGDVAVVADTTGSTGGGGAHTHAIPAWSPKYIDVIICTKD